ncbi:MAG: serine/threonine protein kinase, partial [Myxococcaceae bacterium]|nr:serine/threonine protein kinase [Myxococcaceae bacterium]
RDGEVLGSYQLVSRLGEGGMGDVYLARHTKLGREVALKLLKAELASDADVVRRFFQEARVVNEINHPHIVEVIDFVEEPPHVFCVMEYLRGATLGDLALSAPLPLKRIAHLLQQTCEALHAAHTHGVVHRDVKPANIFVSEREGKPDFVKLLDFGIARLLRTAPAQRTQVGMVIGTPAYMSPEQAQGRVVDARTDIYAVGAVLFELLSGQTLSTTTSPKLAPTALLGEAIPPALAELVTRCISMEPTLRPASALELVSVLKAICDPPHPMTTQRAIAAAGLGAPAHSGRGKWAIGALAILGLGATGVWATRSSPEPAPLPAPVAALAPPEVIDAGVAVVEPVVDAGAVIAALAPIELPPIEPPAAKKKNGRPPARDPLVARFSALKKNYAKLVATHGAAQLTKVERAQVGQSMEDYAANDFKALASTLPEAERALKEATRRLGP